MTEDELTDLLLEHYPTQGIMASPNHWAYGKGWFAHCGTGHADQKGCGWTSQPETYPDKMTARRAALHHLAQEVLR